MRIPLSDNSPLSLTELFSAWTFGECLDDAQFRASALEFIQQLRLRTGCADPHTTLALLRRHANGDAWKDRLDANDPASARLLKEDERFRRWLEQKWNGDAQRPLRRAEVICAVNDRDAKRWAQAAQATQRLHFDGEIELVGIETIEGKATGDHKEVPRAFSARPWTLFAAQGACEIAHLAPDSDEGIFEEVSANPYYVERSYVRVVLSQAHARRVIGALQQLPDEAAGDGEGYTAGETGGSNAVGGPELVATDGGPIASSETKPQSRRGAKLKYDWPAFDRAALEKLDSDCEPSVAHGEADWQNQADFEQFMLAWCEKKWRTTPAVSTVRARCVELLRTYRQKRSAA